MRSRRGREREKGGKRRVAAIKAALEFMQELSAFVAREGKDLLDSGKYV
jgi:hypothetical protein